MSETNRALNFGNTRIYIYIYVYIYIYIYIYIWQRLVCTASWIVIGSDAGKTVYPVWTIMKI